MNKLVKYIANAVLISLFVVPLQFSAPNKAQALSGSDFKANFIISDSIFYNGNTLSTDQIKTFLKSKVPVCDTNGSKPYAGTTRKAYAASRGVSTPFICLKNYSQVTSNKAANSFCKAYPGGSYTAARIIYEVGKACGINQRVLLVLLEKEQSLITDDWPWPIQYRSATGYGCPDTAPCDADYYGFFNQVYNAAKQYKRYKLESNLFNYRAFRTSYVQWHPNAGCGGSNITIQSHATAGLYNYTPYRPNQAALNDLYGNGDLANPAPPNCSSFGNRNFWRIFNNWFGSTFLGCTKNDDSEAYVVRLFSTKYARHYYTTLNCEADQLVYRKGYINEGTTFYQAPAGTDRRAMIYRLTSSSGNKFWTSGSNEINNLVKNHRYKLDGPSFIGYSKNSTEAKSPVYRLYNTKTKAHLWTKSVNERNSVKAVPAWKYEGIAYYVYDN